MSMRMRRIMDHRHGAYMILQAPASALDEADGMSPLRCGLGPSPSVSNPQRRD